MHRTKMAYSFALVALAAFALLAAPAAKAQETQNVILIGWDGAQRNHVKEMLERNELPVLASLAKEGKMVDIDVVTGATDTKAGWAQIMTGYAPEKTGVYSNGRFQPIPQGYTIFERAEEFFGADKVQTRAIIGKKNHVGAAPPKKIPLKEWRPAKKKKGKKKQGQKKKDKAVQGQPAEGQADLPKADAAAKAKKKKGKKGRKRKKKGRRNLKGGKIVEEEGVKYVAWPAKPFFNAQSKMDLFVNGLLENDKVGNTALENLEMCKDDRFLFFIHFADPDHSGHKHGENSQEYSDAIKSDDEWTGKIIAKLKELGIYKKTLVYIVVDHGFDEGQRKHKYAPYVFLATNDKNITRNGAREDIAPTVLKRLGFDLSKIDPPLDGIALDEQAPERIAPAEPPKKKGKGKQGQAKKKKGKKGKKKKNKAGDDALEGGF